MNKCEPGRDCPSCERLVEFRHHHRELNPDYHNAPVPTWYPDMEHGGKDAVRLLIVGLAPGLKGANRTGRPFTGDWAGDLLYATLCKFGFAEGRYAAEPDDTLKLRDCAITNAVRCVPPQNKPVGAEINACRPYLINTLDSLTNLVLLVTLGKISHDRVTRCFVLYFDVWFTNAVLRCCWFVLLSDRHFRVAVEQNVNQATNQSQHADGKGAEHQYTL